ncbi:hypothetical protein H6G64_04535 [Calothrix sp. FACHB-156]|nr:hypothetical protein [Calothrix sp. FACHB-156]
MCVQSNLLLFFAIFTCSLTLVLSIYFGLLNTVAGFIAIAAIPFGQKEPFLESALRRLTATLGFL